MFDKIISTDLKIHNNKKHNKLIFDKYVFKTYSDNEYEVDFVKKTIKPPKYSEISKYIEDEKITCVDINFTHLSEENNYGSENYINKTGLNEFHEVIGKLLFTVKTFSDKNPRIKLYSVGKDNSLGGEIYKKIHENLFADNAIMIEDESDEYKRGCYYFIKK